MLSGVTFDPMQVNLSIFLHHMRELFISYTFILIREVLTQVWQKRNYSLFCGSGTTKIQFLEGYTVEATQLLRPKFEYSYYLETKFPGNLRGLSIGFGI